MLQIFEETVEVLKLATQERINERIVDVPVLQISKKKKRAEMEPQDHNVQREVEQIVIVFAGVTRLQTLEEHRRVDASTRLSPEVTCRRVGADRRLSLRVSSRRGKSCFAGTGTMAEGWFPGELEIGVGLAGRPVPAHGS